MTALTKCLTPTLRHYFLVGLSAAALCVLALQRLLWRGYQFVGNDFDLTQFWIPSSKFFRLWMHSGILPHWNPYIGGGYPLERPDELYCSAINLLQWILPQSDKSLDFILLGHAVLLAMCTSWLLLQYRFSPMVSVLGGLGLVTTGTPCAQLFAGHVSLYCVLCWSSGVLLAQRQAMKARALGWTLLYSLILSVPMAYGSYEGVYILALLQVLFLALQIALGHPYAVQPIGIISVQPLYPAREPSLFFLSSVRLRERLRDAGWALVKTAFASVVALSVTHCYWASSMVHGYLTTNHPLTEANAAPLCWISLLIPSFLLGDGTDYAWTFFPGWEGAPGIGGSFLLLLLAALVASSTRSQVILPVSLALTAAAIGSGQYLPFYRLYANFDPFLGLLEVPSRLFFVCNFGFVLLLAWSMQTLLNSSEQLPLALQPKMRYIWFPVGIFWVVTYYSDGSSPLWRWFFKAVAASPRLIPEAYYVVSWTKLSAEILLLSGISYCLVRLPRRAFAPLLGLLVSIDLLSFPTPYLNLRPHEELDLPIYAFDLLKEKKITGGILNNYDPNWFGQLMYLRYHEFGSILRDNSWDRALVARLIEPELPMPAEKLGSKWENPNNLYRFLGLRLYLRKNDHNDELRKSPLYSGFTAYAIEAENLLALVDDKARTPLYFSRSMQVASSYRALAARIAKDYQPQEFINYVRAHEAAESLATIRQRQWFQEYDIASNPNEGGRVVDETPDRVLVECSLAAPALVTLNSAYDKRWSVVVDDAADKVLPCQLGLNRGVWVGPGYHQIAFHFQDFELDALIQTSRKAALIALASWFLSLIPILYRAFMDMP